MNNNRIVNISTALMIFSILSLAIITTAAADNKIYFNPSDSSADYGNVALVELRVNADTFRSGQMEFTYDSDCCDVVGFDENDDEFNSIGWVTDTAGRERITFYASNELSGDYLLGTLSIQCESEQLCTTDLDFDEVKCFVFNTDEEIQATWEDGTFSCTGGVIEDNEIYFSPSDSSADYGNVALVELRVNADTFRSGQMEFTYDSDCCDIVGFDENDDEFNSIGWVTDTAGRERITFYASNELSGDYLLGTLSIQCESEQLCTTDLDFDEVKCFVFDTDEEIQATWEDGTFSCTGGVIEDNEIYFNPSDSSASYGNVALVELRVNAGTFRSGQMEFTYDSNCCDVVGFDENDDEFNSIGWVTDTAGRERITFYASSELSGDYLLGTLSIQCENEQLCTTDLDFDEVKCFVFNTDEEIQATWEDGTFSCDQEPNDSPTVTVIYPNGGETLSGMVTLNATATDTDGTITSVVFSYSADGGTNWNGIGDGNSVGNDVYTYSWDTTSVADGSNYKIRAVATDNDGAIDEDTSDNVFEIDNGGCSCDYCLQLEAGLSLVSIPRTIEGSNNAKIVFGIDPFIGERCLYYNASAGNYDEVSYVNISVKPCRGYWVEKKEPYTVCVNFSETALPSQQLLKGWNMIGNPSLYEIVIYEEDSITDFGSIMRLEDPLNNPLYSQINRYNQYIGIENYPLDPDFTHMTPGLGYLILMNEDVMMYGIP